MLRRRLFWVLLAFVSAGCALVAVRLFPKAFPLVSLNIAMDRAHAIAAARTLASHHNWGPGDVVRDVASFGSDGGAQSFVELEGGGKPAFAALLQDDLFSPFAWQIRLFKESETRQVVVRFKPAGGPYGFDETLREKDPGAALAAPAARELAESAARAAPWLLPLARFQLIESSQVTRPGGRIDHTFTYERPDRQLGEGRLRLRLVVSGDRLTELTHFVKVPEAFTRRYAQMRSANNAIAGGAAIAVGLLYLLAGGGGGLAYLIRQRALLWRQPLVWAGVIAAFQLAAALSAWPLEWLRYDTALSASGFLSERLVALVVTVLGTGFLCFIAFAAAEGLSRRAFPAHPQLWQLWSRDAGPTSAVLGRTLGGYLLAAVGIVYVSVFYYVAFRHLGWWTPSEALIDPNSLAHRWPWVTPVAQAAQAGFMEEALFRAIPLAGAALLGTRFGGRRYWIAGAFLLQAIVFAAAHANYPGQPAYSRLVELLVPSFVFAALYLRFGLFPGILLHFVYDVILMSLPLFAASADGVWIDRSLVILISLVPLWIILWRRIQAGAWRELPAPLLNGGWQPPAASATQPTPEIPAPSAENISPRLRLIVTLAGLGGLAAWWLAAPHAPVAEPLRIGRVEAIAAARAELARRNVSLPAGHRADASVASRPWEMDRFVWQTAGPEGYRALLGSYVPHPRWVVRFANFTGDVAERAEEWHVGVSGDGHILRVSHRLPEARAGANPGEAEARARVHDVLRQHWALDPAVLTEMSATSTKHPSRIDWTFAFKDPAVKSVSPGEARVQVVLAGDEVADTFRFVFQPEEWQRLDRARQSAFQVGGIVKGLTTAALILTGIAFAIIAWSRKQFEVRVALTVAVFSAVLAAIGTANHWPVISAGFTTSQPLPIQQAMAVLGGSVAILVSSAGLGLLAGFAVRRVRAAAGSERQVVPLGAGLAAAVAGALGLVALLRTNAAPPWPPFDPAASFAPAVATLTSAIRQLLSQSILLLLVLGFVDRFTAAWQRRRATGTLLVFVVSGILLVPWGGLTVGAWLAMALLAAGVSTAAWLTVLRRDLTLVPLFCGVSGALEALGNGLPQPYPGALPTAAGAAVLVIALGAAGLRFLRRHAARQPVAS